MNKLYMTTLKKYFYLLGLSVFLTEASSFAQNPKDSSHQAPRVLTLGEAIAGLDKNPALMSFDEKINSSNAYAKGARSLDPPKVSAGLWMFPYGLPKNNSDGMAPENQGSLMIGIEQMIMNPAKRRAEQRYMEGMSSVEQTMKSYDRQNMIEEMKKMYYEWIILKKKQAVLKESEKLISLMIKSGEIGYTYNQNQLSRIYKAKSELYAIQNMQIMIENEIRQMNIGLNTMMNIDKSIVFEVDTNYTIADYDVLPIDTNQIRSNRSDIKNIEASVKLFELRRTLELRKRRPDFGIQYAHMNSFGSMPNQFNLMGMITIPIAPWSAKGYRANLEGLKYETKALDLKKKAIINEASGNLEKLRSDIGNKKRQVKMYQQNLLPALEKNFNTSLIAFEHMKEDMFMTLDGWIALKMAKIEYLDLVGELLKLQASYERQIEKN
jgi:cobalt-zinc-cadmium efflux system outer membrane protein